MTVRAARVELTRENIRSGAIRQAVMAADPNLQTLGDAERAASLAATLGRWNRRDDIWLFAYGSLIWNPCFRFVERQVGVVRGYHRSYCLWTALSRGTPERPGLTLGLEPGGACRGLVYRIAAGEVLEELDIVWRREMMTGAYAPRWVRVAVPGGWVDAIVFVINRSHPCYAGGLPEATVVETVAGAAGPLGSCSDYLANTVDHLAEYGINDRMLLRLRKKVVARCER
jgi:cation transport protein ChaC